MKINQFNGNIIIYGEINALFIFEISDNISWEIWTWFAVYRFRRQFGWWPTKQTPGVRGKTLYCICARLSQTSTEWFLSQPFDSTSAGNFDEQKRGKSEYDAKPNELNNKRLPKKKKKTKFSPYVGCIQNRIRDIPSTGATRSISCILMRPIRNRLCSKSFFCSWRKIRQHSGRMRSCRSSRNVPHRSSRTLFNRRPRHVYVLILISNAQPGHTHVFYVFSSLIREMRGRTNNQHRSQRENQSN